MGRLIDADKLSADMYHEAFEKDSDMQKWDSGCWIRYKMFENVLKAQPTVEPDTTTHDSIPAKTGKNDGDRTSGDCISRQAAIDEIHEDAEWLASQGSDWQVERMERDKSILMSLPSVQPETNCSEIPNNSDTISRQAVTKFLNDWLSCLFENCHKQSASDLKMIIKDFKNLPSAQPERPTGEWIQKPRYEDDEYPDAQPNLKCPFCGYEISWWDMGNYCARCGADLRGDENE